MLKKISNFVSTLANSGTFGFILFILLLPLWVLLCIIAGIVDGVKAPKESDVKEVDHVSNKVESCIDYDIERKEEYLQELEELNERYPDVVNQVEREYVKKLPRYTKRLGKYEK